MCGDCVDGEHVLCSAVHCSRCGDSSGLHAGNDCPCARSLGSLRAEYNLVHIKHLQMLVTYREVWLLGD